MAYSRRTEDSQSQTPSRKVSTGGLAAPSVSPGGTVTQQTQSSAQGNPVVWAYSPPTESSLGGGFWADPKNLPSGATISPNPPDYPPPAGSMPLKNLGMTQESSIGLSGYVLQAPDGTYYGESGNKLSQSPDQIQSALSGQQTVQAEAKAAHPDRGFIGDLVSNPLFQAAAVATGVAGAMGYGPLAGAMSGGAGANAVADPVAAAVGQTLPVAGVTSPAAITAATDGMSQGSLATFNSMLNGTGAGAAGATGAGAAAAGAGGATAAGGGAGGLFGSGVTGMQALGGAGSVATLAGLAGGGQTNPLPYDSIQQSIDQVSGIGTGPNLGQGVNDPANIGSFDVGPLAGITANGPTGSPSFMDNLSKLVKGATGTGGTGAGGGLGGLGNTIAGLTGVGAGIAGLIKQPSLDQLTKMFDPYSASRAQQGQNLNQAIGQFQNYNPNSFMSGLNNLMTGTAPTINAAQGTAATLGAAPTMSAANINQPDLTAGNFYQPVADLMSGKTPITQDPAYQFNLQQGQQALERQLAASGMSASGNAMTEAIKYGSGMASNEWQQQISNAMNLAGSQAGTQVQQQGQALTGAINQAGLQQGAAATNQATAAQYGLTQAQFEQAMRLQNMGFQQQTNIGNVSNQMQQQQANAQFQTGLAQQQQTNQSNYYSQLLSTLMGASGAAANPAQAASGALTMNNMNTNQNLANIMGGVGTLTGTGPAAQNQSYINLLNTLASNAGGARQQAAGNKE